MLAPPASGVGSACGPCEILAGQAVPRIHLVEARGETLFGFRYRLVRLLLITGTVFAVPGTSELLLGPVAGVLPFLLREASLDVGE